MSHADMPMSHLADKYNQLYSEYTRQFSLHKLKSQLTTIEWISLGGIEFISSILCHDYLSTFRGLLNIQKQKISLLKEEKEIQGRELAYIHCVNQKFR